MKKCFIILACVFITQNWYAQLFVSRDTISVIENGYVLKMPWANGLNFTNVSNIDLNLDGKKDIVAFDKINQFSVGRFRCFINTGVLLAGQTTYSANPDLSYSFPPTANWAVCKDYNCDGKEDLFCSTSAGIMVYKNVSVPGGVLTFSLAKSLIYDTTKANIYAASNAVPGIADIDNDSDLDILTFSPGGNFIEYYKNLSKETYSICDSLNKFARVTGCWGYLTENQCGIGLNQICGYKPGRGSENPLPVQNSLHNGSCLTCLDSDGDLDQDLIMGDITCNIVQFALNGGTSFSANIVDTTRLYPNFPNKNNTQQIKLNNFPCAYYVEVSGDNKKDLIATPNMNGSENYQSMWYYKNTSLTNTVNFQFVKKNFLQDEMIEVGQNSFPVLFDYDGDGLKDLLIGTYGYYNVNTLNAQLTLYRNTGTNSQPSYSLITRDYANVLAQSLNNVIPTVGDIDGDLDIDIVLGTQTGQFHWLKNTAGIGVPATFTFISNAFSLATTPISIAPPAAAAPQLFDIDKDGKLDLMIGGKNGRIWFYKNIGTLTVPQFTFVTSSFGGVNVQGPSNLYGPDGYASPFFYDDAGATKLLCGSITGFISYYSVPSYSVNCNLINATANGYNEGAQSVPYFEDVNNDGKRDLFIGNAGGGLSFFSSKGPDVGIEEMTQEKNNIINLFPNPVKQTLNITVDKIEVENGTLTVSDILGKEVCAKNIKLNSETIDVNELQPGIYFVKIMITNKEQTISVVKKIIKE